MLSLLKEKLKMRTKHVIFLILQVCIILSSCTKKEEEFESKGLILGADLALCACCGSYIIELDNDGKAYRFMELPEDSNLDLSQDSIKVNLNWNFDRECASITYINIEKIEKE